MATWVGLVNTVMVSVKLFPGGSGEKAGGWYLEPLTTRSPQKPPNLPEGAGTLLGTWAEGGALGEVQAAGLAFKAPGGLAPTLFCPHLPALLWLIPLCSYPVCVPSMQRPL